MDITKEQALDWEVRSTWWPSFVCFGWLRKLSSRYLVWKTIRKYKRYQYFNLLVDITGIKEIPFGSRK